MWKIVITIILLSSPAMAFDQWDRTDYTLLATMTAAQVVDWRQTRRISEAPATFHEINPLIGRHPDPGRVDMYFAASWLLKIGVAHVLPSDYRKLWLSGMIGMSLGLVVHNDSIGIGARW